jgi:hypothetical protein
LNYTSIKVILITVESFNVSLWILITVEIFINLQWSTIDDMDSIIITQALSHWLAKFHTNLSINASFISSGRVYTQILSIKLLFLTHFIPRNEREWKRHLTLFVCLLVICLAHSNLPSGSCLLSLKSKPVYQSKCQTHPKSEAA